MLSQLGGILQSRRDTPKSMANTLQRCDELCVWGETFFRVSEDEREKFCRKSLAKWNVCGGGFAFGAFDARVHVLCGQMGPEEHHVCVDVWSQEWRVCFTTLHHRAQ